MLPSSGRFLLCLNSLQKPPLIPVARLTDCKNTCTGVYEVVVLGMIQTFSTLIFRLQQTRSPRVAFFPQHTDAKSRLPLLPHRGCFFLSRLRTRRLQNVLPFRRETAPSRRGRSSSARNRSSSPSDLQHIPSSSLTDHPPVPSLTRRQARERQSGLVQNQSALGSSKPTSHHRNRGPRRSIDQPEKPTKRAGRPQILACTHTSEADGTDRWPPDRAQSY